VRAHRICKPGDTLTISIKPKRLKMPLATVEGQIRVGQEKAIYVEEITLTYGLRDAMVQPVPVADVPVVQKTESHLPAAAARIITPVTV
jgi:3-hydroxyacyl-[acyl-carrier-protein] dehydratase